MIEVKEVVITDLSKRRTRDNERHILEIYTKDGELIACFDEEGNYYIEDMIEFGEFCRTNSELAIIEAYHKWKMS